MMWTQPRATRTVTLVPYTTFFRSDPDRLPPGAYVHLERRCGSGAAQDAGVLIGTRDSGLGTRDSGLGTRDSGLGTRDRSEENTSELQALMRISYAVFCLKKNRHINRVQYKAQE